MSTTLRLVPQGDREGEREVTERNMEQTGSARINPGPLSPSNDHIQGLTNKASDQEDADAIRQRKITFFATSPPPLRPPHLMTSPSTTPSASVLTPTGSPAAEHKQNVSVNIHGEGKNAPRENEVGDGSQVQAGQRGRRPRRDRATSASRRQEREQRRRRQKGQEPKLSLASRTQLALRILQFIVALVTVTSVAIGLSPCWSWSENAVFIVGLSVTIIFLFASFAWVVFNFIPLSHEPVDPSVNASGATPLPLRQREEREDTEEAARRRRRAQREQEIALRYPPTVVFYSDVFFSVIYLALSMASIGNSLMNECYWDRLWHENAVASTRAPSPTRPSQCRCTPILVGIIGFAAIGVVQMLSANFSYKTYRDMKDRTKPASSTSPRNEAQARIVHSRERRRRLRRDEEDGDYSLTSSTSSSPFSSPTTRSSVASFYLEPEDSKMAVEAREVFAPLVKSLREGETPLSYSFTPSESHQLQVDNTSLSIKPPSDSFSLSATSSFAIGDKLPPADVYHRV